MHGPTGARPHGAGQLRDEFQSDKDWVSETIVRGSRPSSSAPPTLGEVLILCDRDTVTLYHPCIYSGNGRVTMRDGSEPGSLHGGPGVLGIKDDLIRPGAKSISLFDADMELQDEGLYVAAKTEVSMKHREDYDVGKKRGLPPSSGADKKRKKLETEKPAVKKPSVKKPSVKKPAVKKPSVKKPVAAAVKKPCKPAVGDTVHIIWDDGDIYKGVVKPVKEGENYIHFTEDDSTWYRTNKRFRRGYQKPIRPFRERPLSRRQVLRLKLLFSSIVSGCSCTSVSLI